MELWSAFFNLAENPFGETPNTRFFYFSDQHREALGQLAWMISSGKGFAMLSGEVGTGKTLVCRMLLKSLQDKANTALILQPLLSGPELLDAILDDFGVHDTRKTKSNKKNGEGRGDASVKQRLDLLNDFLLAEAGKGRKSLLIIDDAQLLPRESLELVRILSNLETESQKLLQIIFVGQPELRSILDSSELRQLGQRLSTTPQLQPLDERNTAAYVAHRIDCAGGASYLRFHPKALKRVHQECGGIPRLINRLCESIVLEAASRHLRLVEASLVKEISSKQNASSVSAREAGGLASFFRGFRGGPSP